MSDDVLTKADLLGEIHRIDSYRPVGSACVDCDLPTFGVSMARDGDHIVAFPLCSACALKRTA